MKKLLVCGSLILLCVAVCASLFAANRGQTLTANYGASNWRVTLSDDGRLNCFGAGQGTWRPIQAVLVATSIDQFWTAGSSSGPVIVYRHGRYNYHAVIYQNDTGHRIISGLIHGQDNVQNVQVNGRAYGAHIFLTLNDGRQETWSIWKNPNLPGKIQKGIVN